MIKKEFSSGMPLGIIATSDNGVAITGEGNRIQGGYEELYVNKLDSQYNLQWERAFLFNKSVIGRKIIQTRNQNYVIFSDDNSLIKLNRKGNVVWIKKFSSTLPLNLFCIISTVDGGLILGGGSTSQYYGSFCIIKLDSLKCCFT